MIASLALTLFTPLAFAADPSPPPNVAEKQADLQGRLAEVRGRLATATEATRAASADFKQCRNGKLQRQFVSTLARLETGRLMLEATRRAAEHRRRELETGRRELEKERRASLKHSTAEGRAGAEQTYESKLASDYLEPFDSGVVSPLDAYVAGMTDYASILGRYAQFCTAPGYTIEAGAALVSELSPKTDTLVATAQHLVPESWRAKAARHAPQPRKRGLTAR